MHRRKFFELTTTASSALLLSSLDKFAIMPERINAQPGFELKVFATNWGFNGSNDQFCLAAKKEGYDGIELWWPGDEKAQQDLFTALKKHGLEVGFLCGGWQTQINEHLESFKKMVSESAHNKYQRPAYINCHSGRDHFPMDQNMRFIEYTNTIAKETGITVCHETHRSRIMFAAHVARQYLEKDRAVRLTFDVSHWCNVHESLLQDQQETVAMALDRVEHIHARIGHPEGPQVNDPRAPEWEATVAQHFAWWDKVAERKKKKGERMTVLTEFGPPDYMPTLPYTRQPLADQWAINVHMMKLLRQRYGS